MRNSIINYMQSTIVIRNHEYQASDSLRKEGLLVASTFSISTMDFNKFLIQAASWAAVYDISKITTKI